MHMHKKGLAQATRERGWRLDRRVSAGLVIALLVQAGSIVWWASGKEQQDHFRDARLAQTEILLSRYDAALHMVAERLARLETRLESQGELLKRIDNKIDTMRERR